MRRDDTVFTDATYIGFFETVVDAIEVSLVPDSRDCKRNGCVPEATPDGHTQLQTVLTEDL